jgi:hypothetical protein
MYGTTHGTRVEMDADMASAVAKQPMRAKPLSATDKLDAFIRGRQRYALWTEAQLQACGSDLVRARSRHNVHVYRLVPSRAGCPGTLVSLQETRGTTLRLTEESDDASLEELHSLPWVAALIVDNIVEDDAIAIVVKPNSTRVHVPHLLTRMVVSMALQRRPSLKSVLPDFTDVPRSWKYKSLWEAPKGSDLGGLARLSETRLCGDEGVARTTRWYIAHQDVPKDATPKKGKRPAEAPLVKKKQQPKKAKLSK